MNLTITIDDETLQRARLRAVAEDTSVNAVVRDFLAQLRGSQGRGPRGDGSHPDLGPRIHRRFGARGSHLDARGHL